MIKEISKDNISECTKVIIESFSTVAKEFNITKQNAPRYVAFAMTDEKLSEQYNNGRKMFAYFDDGRIVGFYALEFFDNECEMNHLCVLPEYRHRGIAKELLNHSFDIAMQSGTVKMKISIVEENQQLKKWYLDFGFKPICAKKFDFFPFTCGYMEKNLIDFVTNTLTLEFIKFLTDNEMSLEKAGGYWQNQQYFYVKYKSEFVCYILINGKGDEAKFYPFTVWSDDSNSKWYCKNNLDEHNRNIAIKHIDICEKCGACKGGTTKQIFGTQYNNVCRTTFRFINPNADELECLKMLVLLRKCDIDRG